MIIPIMFEAKFKLKHKGCWTTGLRKFKSEFITHNIVSLNENFVQDITEVILFNKKEAAEIKRYLKTNKLIKKYEILQETETRLLIQIFTDTSKIKSIVHTILRNKCFVAKKVPLIEGWEIESYHYIVEGLSKYGINKDSIWSNGYCYKFESGVLRINMFLQSGSDTRARIVGEICDRNQEDLEGICKEMKGVDSKKDANGWSEMTIKYNFRPFCIWGDNLQDMIQKLMGLVNTPIEEYVRNKLEQEMMIKELMLKEVRK